LSSVTSIAPTKIPQASSSLSSLPSIATTEIPQPFFPIYINCGGTELHEDFSNPNITWIPDDSFLVGDSKGVSFFALRQQPFVNATIDNAILRTGRKFLETNHSAHYEIPAFNASATFLISLYFVDWDEDWSRTFDVIVEGYTIIPSLNVLLEAGGPNVMYRLDAIAPVADESISIELGRVKGDPTIAAIVIRDMFALNITMPIALTPSRIPTYVPGNLTVSENGLILSEGLTAKIIGTAGQLLTYADGQKSDAPFHTMPDAGACFVDSRLWNMGGWIYVSNSEAKEVGGVGALTFNKFGELIDYRMILEDTRMNCGGGTTPWGAWVSVQDSGCTCCEPEYVLGATEF
jgi:hypothetical protein